MGNKPHPKSLSTMERDFKTLVLLSLSMVERGLGGEVTL
jgi:hypothetical protein